MTRSRRSSSSRSHITEGDLDTGAVDCVPNKKAEALPSHSKLVHVTDLTADDRAALNVLSAAVYPPDEHWSGSALEWAPAQWCVCIRENDVLVSYTGIVLRDAMLDGAPVRIGGVGGIKTHPAARGRGYARDGVRRALQFFHDQDVAFALLVCEPHLLAYYASLGWIEFRGRLLVTQRGASDEFTFNRVMTHDVRATAPNDGEIDLCGPPW